MMPGGLLVICVYLALAPVFSPLSLNLYDRARGFQLIALLLIAVFFLLESQLKPQRRPELRLPDRAWAIGLGALIFLAVMSASLAAAPLLAFTELALWFALFTAGYSVYHAARSGRSVTDRVLLAATFISILLFTMAFTMAQAEAVEDGWPFEWISPFVTFANVRFFSQYQAYTLALVAIPLLALGFRLPSRIGAAVLGACWWALQFAVATRAVWFAVIAVTVFLLLFLRREAGPFLRCQGVLLLVGGLVYFLFTTFVFGEAPGLGRVVQSGLDSSLRIPLWQSALAMILDAPLLGVGPMHYALRQAEIAAHPHNSWLQIAAEYGLPAAALASYLVIRLVWVGVGYCRRSQGTDRNVNVALLAAIVLGLTDSMLSGNTLMPHSQMALAVVAGWLLGRNAGVSGNSSANTVAATKGYAALAALAVLCTGIIATGTVNYFSHGQWEKHGGFGKIAHPRFWHNGHWPGR